MYRRSEIQGVLSTALGFKDEAVARIEAHGKSSARWATFVRLPEELLAWLTDGHVGGTSWSARLIVPENESPTLVVVNVHIGSAYNLPYGFEIALDDRVLHNFVVEHCPLKVRFEDRPIPVKTVDAHELVSSRIYERG